MISDLFSSGGYLVSWKNFSLFSQLKFEWIQLQPSFFSFITDFYSSQLWQKGDGWLSNESVVFDIRPSGIERGYKITGEIFGRIKKLLVNTQTNSQLPPLFSPIRYIFARNSSKWVLESWKNKKSVALLLFLYQRWVGLHYGTGYCKNRQKLFQKI